MVGFYICKASLVTSILDFYSFSFYSEAKYLITGEK